MRAVIVADIHSNLDAFQSVLRDAEARGGVDEVWCLGDIVGYGPQPRECIALLKEYNHLCVAGNHDWAAVGKIDISDFNSYAAEACMWTSQQLQQGEKGYLTNLPLHVFKDDFTLVHGSPREPIWEYVVSHASAWENFRHFKTPFCLIGHSHLPLAFQELKDKGEVILRTLPEGLPFSLGEGRLIINPGGVGQPRDGDPRAGYAIYDDSQKCIVHYRVPYDIASTQQKMERVGLPSLLIERLSYGR